MKRLNQRLYDQLGGPIIHIFNYAKENNIPLPNKDKLYDLVNKAESIIDDINKLSDENISSPTEPQQRNKTTEDSTEPVIINLKMKKSYFFQHRPSQFDSKLRSTYFYQTVYDYIE